MRCIRTMHKHRIPFLAAVLVLLAGPAGATSAPVPLTLQEAVAIGLEKNPVRKAALANRRAAEAGQREARAGFLPRLNFSEAVTGGNDPVYVFGTKLRQNIFTGSDFALSSLNTPSPITNFATRFGANWTVFDSFATQRNLQRSKQMTQIAASELTRTDQELIFRIVDAYYGLLLVAKQAELAEGTVNTAQAVLDSSKARVESGMTVESDALAAQVNLAARQQDLIAANNALAFARARLSTALGMPASEVYLPAEPLAERVLPDAVLEEVEARALRERPDLKQADLQRVSQQTGVALAKSAFGPSINVFADWELDNHNFASNGGHNWMAGAELKFEIFSGGQRRAQLDLEKSLLERATALRQSAKDSVRLDVRRAFYDHEAARQMLEVARTAVAQAEESLRITQNRYSAGLTPITELLRAEDAARTTRTSYWQSVYRYQETYATLELAAGSLTPDSRLVTP